MFKDKLLKLRRQSKRNKILKGLVPFLVPKIKYEVRNLSGDWSSYFGNYVGQRYGNYDTYTCWNYGGVEICETQLEFLWKTNQFSEQAKKWFKDNGYIDSDGDFYLSRRWAAIISGVKDSGNDQDYYWDIIQKVGLIPFSMLPYSTKDASDELTQDDFNNEYFDTNVITPQMEALGKEFLKWVKIEHEEVGKRWTRRDIKQIEAELKQSPLQLGVPVPQDGSWNQVFIKWEGRTQPDHSIECYKYQELNNYPWFWYDSYEPHLKRGSVDYYVPLITKGVLTAVPQPVVIFQPAPQVNVWVLVWTAVQSWFNRIYGLKEVKVA